MITSSIASCEKGPNFREFSFPAPTVTGMSPNTGYPTSKVVITGSNFGEVIGPVSVWFNGVKADSVLSCTNDQIVVKVPDLATSGKVSLKIWTHIIDSIGSFTVKPIPIIDSLVSLNVVGKNIATPGDTLVFYGKRFGTDASAISVSMNGAQVTVVTPITDNLFKIVAPSNFSTGNVTLNIGGIKIAAPTVIINPFASGDITPYFLANTGNIANGGGFTSSVVSGRWGVLGAPWITSAAAKNKNNGTIGGWTKDAGGCICWETWGNTPVVDGTVYQPTLMPLPAGNYTITIKYYSEIQQNSTLHLEVAAGKNGIPLLANLSSAIASLEVANPAVVGKTAPNVTETKSLDFTLATSQYVSIGFLANLKWGNGTSNPGNYVTIQWIKLVKK
ncbi:MAG TPA: DUF5013 domain-containing protein [Pelobium sp.]|nr:DUF5013 domain-containing protein [Pelobium sp.]